MESVEELSTNIRFEMDSPDIRLLFDPDWLNWLMILAVVMAMIAICIVASDDSLVDYLAKLKNNSDNFISFSIWYGDTYDHQ